MVIRGIVFKNSPALSEESHRKWGHYGTLNVPIKLCEYSLKHKLCKELRLFIYLKGTCEGTRQITYADVNQFGFHLKKTPRTIQTGLKKLIGLNWIGYNFETKNYFIRSFDRLLKSLALGKSVNALLHFEDLEHLSAFCLSTHLTYLIKARRYHQRRNSTRIDQKRNALQGRKTPKMTSLLTYKPHFNPEQIATVTLVNKFKRSKSNISHIKAEAVKAGFITVEKRFSQLFPNLTKPLGLSGLNHAINYLPNQLRECFPDIANKVKMLNGIMIIQECDFIRTSIKLRHWKKKETI